MQTPQRGQQSVRLQWQTEPSHKQMKDGDNLAFEKSIPDALEKNGDEKGLQRFSSGDLKYANIEPGHRVTT